MSSSQDFISSWLPLVRTWICQEAARHLQSRCDTNGTWWNFTKSSSPIHWGPAPPSSVLQQYMDILSSVLQLRGITKIIHPKNLREYNVWTNKSMQDLSSPYWMQQIFFIDPSFPSDLKNASIFPALVRFHEILIALFMGILISCILLITPVLYNIPLETVLNHGSKDIYHPSIIPIFHCLRLVAVWNPLLWWNPFTPPKTNILNGLGSMFLLFRWPFSRVHLPFVFRGPICSHLISHPFHHITG